MQIDGCEHDWSEDRGPSCTLLGVRRQRHERARKPVTLYSDKHSIFRVVRREAPSSDGMTQFGRALHELNIDILCANTSQAKGRVERAHQTLQDRLVKELRLQGISDKAAGSAFPFLSTFSAGYNTSASVSRQGVQG